MEVLFNAIREQEPDWNLIYTDTGMLSDYVYNQAILPLNDYIDHDYFEELPAPLQPIEEMVIIGGGIYGIPTQRPNLKYPFNVGYAIIWNRDFFEHNNLPDIDELQDEGKWTWDKFTDIARQVTRDTNNDGYIDQWGLGGFSPFQFSNLLETYGVNLYETTADGKIESINLTSNNVISAFEYLKKWDQIIPPFAHNSKLTYEYFKDGKIAMSVIRLNDFNYINQEIDHKLGLAYFPRGPERDDYILPVGTFTVVSVPVTERDPKRVINIHDKIFKPEDVYKEIDRETNKMESNKNREAYYDMTENWKNSQFDLLINKISYQIGDTEKMNSIYRKIYEGKEDIRKGDKEAEDVLMEIEIKIKDNLL